VGDLLSRGLNALQTNLLYRLAVLAVILIAVGCGMTLGLSAALLVLASGVLLGGILLFWTSLQGLGGETPLTLDEALSLGAPSAEEEQKQAVLRALKDLEFERSVGKISDDDYVELSQRYRAEAKALLLLVDRDLGPAMKHAEALVAERLGKRQRGSVREVAAEDDEPTHNESTDKGACPKCHTANDLDARFCKSCGHALRSPSEQPS